MNCGSVPDGPLDAAALAQLAERFEATPTNAAYGVRIAGPPTSMS